MAKSILVTGEAGYIGSDRVLQLLLGGFKVVVVDNLDNDSEIAVRRVAEIAGEVGKKNLVFHKVDLQDKEALGKIFAASSFDAVIHFAGLKAVGESVQKPPPNNDVIGLINVLETMAAYGCKKGCGSSSSIEAHSELGQETQRQALETEGQIKKWWTFLYRLVSKLKAANNQTPIYPDDLKAKTVLILGFTALLGLLGVSYRINGHGNMVPTALFHKPTNTFTFFLMIIMMMVYCAAIGLMLAKACPRIAKVLNVISFLCLLLGVTVLLWTLCPRSINWIPWAFFACPFVAAFGVAVYWLFTETSSATASLRSSSHPPSQV